MKITDIIIRLEQARMSHIRWIAKAEALIEGVPLDKASVPLLDTDCEFGQWYYGDGRILRHFQHYDMLHHYHHQVHRVYMDIFTILYGKNDKKNILQWLGIQREFHDDKRQKAQALLPQLKNASQELLIVLDQFLYTLQQHKKNSKPTSTQELEALMRELQDMGFGDKNKP